MSDKDFALYRRFLEGDEECLEQLIALYRRGLLRFIYGYVQDIGLAEDVFVDVFSTLYFKRPFEQRENATLKTYLYTIARNKALNALKKQKRRKELSLESLTEQKGEQATLSKNAPSPEQVLEITERNKNLYRALENIPKKYREVLVLRYFDGLSPEKIAKITKKNQKQVYNLLARGKLALKKQLVKENVYENE